MMLLHRCCC